MFERLIKLIREEKVSLFIGAGFSLEAGSPSVQKIKDTILADFENDIQREKHKQDDLQSLSEYYVEEVCQGSRQKLISDLKLLFQFEPKCMTDHQLLSQVPHFRHIFTTNYDTLLEDSFQKNDVQVVRKDQDLTGLDESKHVTIYKIHGDFQDADSVIITKSDYNDLQKKSNRRNDLIWKVVESEFAQKNILFIGYSLEDDNILEIIRTVTNKLKKNHKQMFLLAPSIKPGRETELKKMHVTYINSYATQFLEQLTKEILDNSSEDFKNNKITAETYSRICNMHGFIPKISLSSEGKNTIEEVKPLPNSKLHRKLNFTVDGKYAKVISRFDFERNGQIVKGSPFPNLPHIKIDEEYLQNSVYSINNIVLGKDFKSILICPVPKKAIITINIPSRNFFEMVEGHTYRLNDNKIVISFDCHVYETKIIIEFGKEISKNLTVNFTFTFHESYTDNNKAILWIDFIDALFSKEKVTINSPIKMDLNTTNNYFSSESCSYAKFKSFYKNIKDIELLSGYKFKTYNGYTDDLYQNSVMVLAYLKKEIIKFESKGGINFSVRVPSDDEFVKVAKINEKYAIVTGSENLIYEINDRKFNVPYMHNILSTCIISNIHAEDDGYTVIDLHYVDDVYYTQLNDKPINVKYKELTDIKHVDIEFKDDTRQNIQLL